MKTTITLKRFYFKEVEIEVDNKLLEGMDDEEISDFLIEEYSPQCHEDDFNKVEYQHLEIDHKDKIQEDTDRYDIYRNGKQVFGGHL